MIYFTTDGPFYRWNCLTAEPVAVPALQYRCMCGAGLKCYAGNIQCEKKGGVMAGFPGCVQTSPCIVYGQRERTVKLSMVDLTSQWARCTVRTLVGSVNTVPAIMKLEFLLLHSHAQPLGSASWTSRFNQTLQACFLNPLSPSTTVLISWAPRPAASSQSKPCPTLAPGPAYRPVWAEPWVLTCLRREILASELPRFSEDLAWYNIYVLNWIWRLPEQGEGIITVSSLLGLLVLWFSAWDTGQLPLCP